MAHTTWLRRGLADVPPSPFAVLKLSDDDRNLKGEIHHRNYSNLYKPEHQVPAAPPDDWAAVFGDPARPLVVDVGCGAGRCLLLLAHQQQEQQQQQQQQQAHSHTHAHAGHQSGQQMNGLGLDIHTALMDRANQWASERGLAPILHYRTANAAISLPSLLATYPGQVALVCVQYPDPALRSQRHVVHADFVADLAALLRPGAQVLLQSELHATASHMRDTFEEHGGGAFRLADEHSQTGATFRRS
ncbi:hypothetical protein FOA52_004234 [Chlamydomonas sp. UWO 241]|nr:hypothetical protein FOA52_004234 [Chlamydomonas sp. UWO 241]